MQTKLIDQLLDHSTVTGVSTSGGVASIAPHRQQGTHKYVLMHAPAQTFQNSLCLIDSCSTVYLSAVTCFLGRAD